MNLPRLVLPLFAALFLFGGCKTVNRTERAEPRARPDVVQDRRIETDPSAADRIAVTQVAEDTSGEFLRIQISLESTSSRTRTYSYQVEWIEANGFTVTSPAPVWKPLRIAGRDTASIVAVAPNPRVVDFRFKLIETYREKIFEP